MGPSDDCGAATGCATSKEIVMSSLLVLSGTAASFVWNSAGACTCQKRQSSEAGSQVRQVIKQGRQSSEAGVRLIANHTTLLH